MNHPGHLWLSGQVRLLSAGAAVTAFWLLLGIGDLARAADGAEERAPQTPVAGDSCSTSVRPWVRIVVAGGLGGPDKTEDLVRHLRAELRSRRIDACAQGPTQGDPIAAVRITWSEDGVDVAIDIEDTVARRRLGRTVSLSSIPIDGRLLTASLAVDELLRASWGEPAIGRAAATTASVASGATDTVTSSPGPSAEPPAPPEVRPATPAGVAAAPEIGAVFAYEQYRAGGSHVGADFRGGVRLHQRLTLAAGIGLRVAQEVSAPDGKVRGYVGLASAYASWALTPRAGRAGVDADLRASVERIVFSGDPAPDAKGQTLAGTAVIVAAGATFWVALGRSMRLAVGAAAGIPLRGVYARDNNQTVTAVDGVALLTTVGVFTGF